MPSKAQKILDILKILDICVAIHHHEQVFTVAEAQKLRGEISGAHSKNLFLKDRKGNIFLISALEEAFIDLKTLHTKIGASGRVSFGSQELLMEILGVEPGAVSPLGLINDTSNQCTLVMDRKFLDYETLNFHPLDNRMTVSIAPADLTRLLEETNHAPLYLDF